MPIPAVYTDEGRQMFLGFYYDRLARHLLKSRILTYEEWFNERSLTRYDIYSDELGAGVEMKGSSNVDQMKLFEDQLDGQIGELGFPFDHGFVWIFSYINRAARNGDDPTPRLLRANGKSEACLSCFLAKNTNVAYAIDVRLLDAWKHKNGALSYSRDTSRDRRIISIGRRQLRFMAENLRTSLHQLGFSDEVSSWLPPKARGIPSRIVSSRLGGEDIEFELVLLLQNSLKLRLLKQMNGVVKKM